MSDFDFNIDDLADFINTIDKGSGGHVNVMEQETAREVERLKKRLNKEYKQAEKELEQKAKEYFKKFEKQDKEKKALVDSGKLSKEKYIEWRQNKMLYGETLKQKVEVMSDYLVSVDRQAMNIVNGRIPEVYAKNYNYSGYEIEKQYKINTSFTLHDNKSVERLVKEDPKALPMQYVKDSKAQEWSKRKINNALIQGILQGESIPDIAKRMTTIVGMEKNCAIRNARTAMTGAQNAGRFDSYKDVAKMGIKLKKQWMATLDERTRTSHQELDGETVDIDKEFSNKLKFPGDPQGRPAEVYNCRCTMVADLDDFKPENYQRLDNIDKTPIDNVTYKQWAKSKGKKSESDAWYDKIKEIISDDSLSIDEKIKKAGKIFSDDINESYIEPMAKEWEWLENEKRAIWKLQDNHSLPKDELNKRDSDWNERRNAFRKKYSTDNMSKELADRLGLVRPVGFDDEKALREHLRILRISDSGRSVMDAYKHYPTEWVEKSMNAGKLKVMKVNRGYYDDWAEEIAISGWNYDMMKETAFHELGHRFETAVDGIKSQEKSFYERRTKGETAKWLGSGYAKNEVTKRDKFLNKYMGKDYGGQAYELVSMGFEYAYTDPRRLAKDRDMQEWIHGMLCIL